GGVQPRPEGGDRVAGRAVRYAVCVVAFDHVVAVAQGEIGRTARAEMTAEQAACGFLDLPRIGERPKLVAQPQQKGLALLARPEGLARFAPDACDLQMGADA